MALAFEGETFVGNDWSHPEYVRFEHLGALNGFLVYNEASDDPSKIITLGGVHHEIDVSHQKVRRNQRGRAALWGEHIYEVSSGILGWKISQYYIGRGTLEKKSRQIICPRMTRLEFEDFAVNEENFACYGTLGSMPRKYFLEIGSKRIEIDRRRDRPYRLFFLYKVPYLFYVSHKQIDGFDLDGKKAFEIPVSYIFERSLSVSYRSSKFCLISNEDRSKNTFDVSIYSIDQSVRERVAVVKSKHSAYEFETSISDCGKFIAGYTRFGALELYDTSDTSSPVLRCPELNGGIISARFSRDSSKLFLLTADGKGLFIRWISLSKS